MTVAPVERRDYLLIGVSTDGFASLLDLESGAINASLPLPAPAHLRRNTEEEEAAYKALVRPCTGPLGPSPLRVGGLLV